MPPAREVELNDVVDPEVVGRKGVAPPANNGLRFRSPPRGDDDNYSDEGDEIDSNMYVDQEPLDESEGQWAMAVLVFSGVDILGSGVIFCTALKYAYRDISASLYTLSFQAMSHWITSLLLLSRFVGEVRSLRGSEGAEQGLMRRRRRSQLYREQCLSMTLALVMLLSSCGFLFKAFRKLRFWKKWYIDIQRVEMDKEIADITEWLAWSGFVLYLIQAIFRFLAARRLRVCLATHACVASIISLLYLLVLGVAASWEHEVSWKAEPIAAIVLVVLTLIEGIRIVYYYLDDMDTRVRENPRA